jgi:hypothetical protein
MVLRDAYHLLELPEQIENETGRGMARWFRGQACADWPLRPSVNREPLQDTETNLNTKFILQAKARYANCPTDNDAAGWLSLMQHHGLPTRLLDWSASVLVAAHFAVAEQWRHRANVSDAEPAALWCLIPGRLNWSQLGNSVLYSLVHDNVLPLLRPAFGGEAGPGAVAAAHPPHDNLRIMLQQGFFTIHDADTPMENLPYSREFLYRLIIPPEIIPPLQRLLLHLGINDSLLFPDLDHLASELARDYRSRR